MPHQCTTCGYVFADGSKEMLSGCPECDGATFQFYSDDTDISEVPPDDPSPPSPSTSPSNHGGRVGKHVGRATSTVREWVSSEPSPTNGSSAADTSSSTSESESKPETESTSKSESESQSESEESTEETDGSGASTAGDGRDADVLATDDDGHTTESNGLENAAQASARSEFVSRDKLPPHSASPSDPAPPSETSSPPPPPGDGRVVREPTGDQPDLAELREELNDQFESIKIIKPGQYELNLMELYDRDEYIIALQENGRYVIQMPESWRGSSDE